MHAAIRTVLLLCSILLVSGLSSAQDRVSLKDGSELEGKVRSVGAQRVVFEAGGTVVELDRSKIAEIRLAPEKSAATAFGITVAEPPPAPKPKAAAPLEAPVVKRKPVATAKPEPPAEDEAARKQRRAIAVREIESENESGWKVLLQNRLGLDPDQPAKILLYALLAFVLITIVVAIASRLADLYSRTANRVVGFSACTVLLLIPQIVWLPADATIVACVLTANFLIWCVLVRVFFHEQLLKSCVLLVGSAFVLLLLALAGEVGRMMLAQKTTDSAAVGSTEAGP
jgi:hypothetical protein